ncbi:ABC transporter ATP-binding protein [Limnochorda pilosa]|uniref:ABC transporter ATP-binding protein n=1 Tax=Limnochorda pilosa TaxID=1555112 RepID=A0A0K2SFT2_LIMPI|nr:ABC transporter ATP-binding protein [Limnochorda pilosa]BAS25950.1 ABC transporter ATP-binding protein [Limnochorda pilosa]
MAAGETRDGERPAGAKVQPAGDSQQALLAVRGLVKDFGRHRVLRGLSFHVQAGEIVALLGPNGAGKTTTLKTVAGLLRLTAGQVLIEGRPHTDAEARRGLALVPEVPSVYELLTAWEHLEFIALAFRLSGWQAASEALLRRYHLWEKRDALGATLSKGQRQKLLICAALLHRPRVFLFDEPLVGLDPAAQRDLKTSLRAMRDEGAAILVSTHMLETVERLCDRAIVMNRGELLAEGTLDQLRERFHLPTHAPLEEVFLEATGEGNATP